MEPPIAIENRDYTIAPNGAWIFTREYLLTRGHCCGSECTNCPFENSRQETNQTRDLAKSRPVISMVPSWTETLVHSSVNVVGRTRFCIHPQGSVKSIAVLGGTKNLSADFEQKMSEIMTRALANGQKPLVILDREENPKEFVDFFSKYDCEILATHISNFDSFNLGLRELSKSLPDQAVSLCEMVRRTKLVTNSRANFNLVHALVKSDSLREGIENLLNKKGTSILYFIWQKPWMIVSRDTWIEAVLKTCFPNASLPSYANRYTEISEIELEKLITENHVLLFSSEPFPFAKNWDEIRRLPFVQKAGARALVDGEVFSWFGIRTIRFLEDALYG